MRHELKCHPVPFRAIRSGMKRHEIRKRAPNEVSIYAGDSLHLREWVPESGQYTGGHMEVDVLYVTQGGEWGLPEDICVMSIAKSE